MKKIFLFNLLFFLHFEVVHATSVRIKDLVEFDGVRSNDLVGYGLVVGLNGTGDERWSRNFGPVVKVDRMIREVIQNEETKEPFA